MKSSTDNSKYPARSSLNASTRSIAAVGSLEEQEQKMPLTRGVTVHFNFIIIF